MAIGSTALAHFLIVLIIGIVVGLFFNRYARTWVARIGFHLGVILGLLPTPLMLYLAAVIGAVVVVWLWRGR